MGSGHVSGLKTPLKLQGAENPSSAIHRMSFTPGKSQADVETSLPLLLFPRGASDNATCCEDLSKKRPETQGVGFCTLRVRIKHFLLLLYSSLCVNPAIPYQSVRGATHFLRAQHHLFSPFLVPIRGQTLLLSLRKIGFCLPCLRNLQHQSDCIGSRNSCGKVGIQLTDL